ncbi:MAG: hemerythrin domain-containing protein, partial [Planctomycetota bacterium]
FSPQQGPTAVMRIEHDEGRELVARIDRAIDGAGFGRSDDSRQFVKAAREFVALLRLHIEKEDHCLFPMAEQSLGPEQQQALLKSFEQVEHEEIGAEVHDNCLRVANELADRFGVPRASVGHEELRAGCTTEAEN